MTLTDLCVGLAVAAFALVTLVPTAALLSRSEANRVKCASNLRTIAVALQTYANAHKGKLPRTVYDGVGRAPVFFTGVNAADPFGPGGPDPNDVTAALFLALRTTDIPTEALLCPSAAVGTPWNLGGQPRASVSNFPGRQFIGYGLTNPYPTLAAAKAGFKFDYTLAPDFPLAADINPGPPGVVSVKPTSKRAEMMRANSPNHRGEGQSVLYADGHVEYLQTPFCGVLRAMTPAGPFRDNIYTFGNGFGGDPSVGVVGAPVDASDSVILPFAPEGPAPASLGGAQPATLLVRAIIAAAVLGIVLVAMTRLRRKPPVAPPSIQ